MVATVTSNSNLPSPNPKRMPLLPSDPGNRTLRRPKAREVTSRYLSVQISSSFNSSSSSPNTSTTISSIATSALPAISSKRYQSPVVSRAGVTTPRNTERAVSVDRRRPVAVEATPSNAERMLVTSMRSLSVSFQGESIWVPVSKAKTAGGVGTPGGGLRKGTSERRKLTPVRDQRERENSRPSDQQQQQQQHRWPRRSRRDNSSFLTQSLDYGAESTKLNGSGTAIKELRKSMIDENGRNKLSVTLNPESYNSEFRMTNNTEIGSNLATPMNTDTETVSLESIENGSTTQLREVQRGVVVPARVWQESNRIHKEPESYSPRSKMSGFNRTPGPSKLIGANKVLIDSPISFPRGFSPLQGGMTSPSKLSMMTSTPLRGIDSPLRIRNGVGNVPIDDNTSSMLSMMSFVTDVRRGKLGESRIVDAHVLRLLYNRQLQWRFVNARAEKSLLVQKQMAQRSLYNAWISTTKMRRSVKFRRIELQLLRHNRMLYSILKGQEPYLEKWDLIDVGHSNALCGAKEALEASIIRLPVVAGARAIVQNVEEAISSAVDVMQTMASSICSLLTKVEQMNFLVSELANLSARENSLLDECKDSLSTRFLPLQVMHCSLRIQLLQLQRVHASSTKEL